MSLEEPYCHDMNPIGHIDQIGSWFVLKRHNLAVAIIENNLLTMLKEDEYRIISTGVLPDNFKLIVRRHHEIPKANYTTTRPKQTNAITAATS